MVPGLITLIVFMTIIGVVVGLVVGIKITDYRYVRDTRYSQGTLNIDCSDPTSKPDIFLGLGVPVNDVITRKHITLDVNVLLKKSHE